MALLGRRVQVDGRDGVIDSILPNMVRVRWLDGDLPAGTWMAPGEVEPHLLVDSATQAGADPRLWRALLVLWYGVFVVALFLYLLQYH